MPKHSIRHSFETEKGEAMVQFELEASKIVKLWLFVSGGQEIDLTPAELVDFAAMLNQAAEWVMALSMKDTDGLG